MSDTQISIGLLIAALVAVAYVRLLLKRGDWYAAKAVHEAEQKAYLHEERMRRAQTPRKDGDVK